MNFRTQTCEAERRSRGTKGLCACERENSGLESNMTKWFLASSSSVKEELNVSSTSSLGIVMEEPKRSCAGEVEVVFDGVFLQPIRTKGNDLVQEELFVRMRNEVLNVLWKRSMSPLHCG